jgi:hypothetical protein
MISATVLHEVVSRDEFHVGLQWGVALTLLVAAAGGLCLWVFKRPAPIAGLVVPIAFANGVKHWVGLPSNVTEGLLLLAGAGLVAGVLASWWRPLALTGVLLAIPGAALLTSNTGLPDVSWVAPLVVVSTVLGGTLVADFDRRYAKRGWPVVMLAVSVVGVYFTVPDTERALVLLGASLPLVLLGWPIAIASLGSVGAYPAVGAIAWTAAFEGRGRHTAIIAGVACLGLFVAEPLTRALQGFKSTVFAALPKTWWMAIPVALVHLVLVFVASRIAGLRTDVSQAVLISVMALISAIAVLWALQSELPRVAPGSLERGSRR